MHRLFFICICIVQITHLKFNHIAFHTASKSALENQLIADQVTLQGLGHKPHYVSRITGGGGGGGGLLYTYS